MATINLYFDECEHQDDLDEYLDDIRKSGGNPVNWSINHNEETANVTVEVTDRNKFFEEFRKTDAYDFCN